MSIQISKGQVKVKYDGTMYKGLEVKGFCNGIDYKGFAYINGKKIEISKIVSFDVIGGQNNQKMNIMDRAAYADSNAGIYE